MWKGRSLRHWLQRVQRRQEGMTTNMRGMVCDMAFHMQMSEREFYEKYRSGEREQLIATYRSQRDREFVMDRFPVKRR